MGESQEILFARTLKEVRALAKAQENCISQQQVEEAFAELKRSAGTHFGPQLIAVFLGLRNEITEYLESH